MRRVARHTAYFTKTNYYLITMVAKMLLLDWVLILYLII